MPAAATAIVIFARAPIPGRVKTRLAPELGQRGAARLHRRMVRRVVEEAARAALGPVRLYATPDIRHPLFLACRRDFGVTLERQRGSDLGARMFHALRDQIRQGHVPILVGSDCPAIDQTYLARAASALGHGNDVVLGPSTDGGYVLIGTRAPRPDLFHAMPWGSPHVLRLTRSRLLRRRFRFRLLPPLPDIDEPVDLIRARRAGILR